MSGKVMGQVWDLKLPQNKQIVLLAMADHADHTGANIFPSIGLLAWKTGYSERHVQRLINSLIDDGILSKQERQGQTNRYAIHIAAGVQKAPYVPKGKDVTPDTTMSPPTPKTEDVTPDTVMSPPPRHSYVTPTPDIAVSPEPSLEPSKNQKDKDSAAGAAPLLIPARALSLQQRQAVEAEQQTKQRNKTARGLIAVYLKTTKTINAKAYQWWMEDAQALVEAGITPAHIADWLTFYTGQDWWTHGWPKWTTLCGNILTWRDERQQAAQPRQLNPALIDLLKPQPRNTPEQLGRAG